MQFPPHHLAATALAGLIVVVVAGKAAADTVLVDDDFESGTLESWTAGGGGSGLYTYDGAAAVDYSTSTAGAAELYRAGTDGTLTLTDPLPLDSQGYTSLTIAFNWKYQNGSSTRRAKLQYAADGSTWVTLREFNTPFGGVPIDGSTSFTLNEGAGANEFEFTDDAKFRFTFGSNRSDHRLYLDDIVISGSPDFAGAEPFSITAIDYDVESDEVTLTWPSRPGETYGVYWSTDMIDWSADLNDSVPAADPGDTTSATFDLNLFGIADLADLFFRVERN